MRDRLTQKQETFCLKYVEMGNATQAAIVAGYKPKTAQVIASENLTKPIIQARVTELRKANADSTQDTLDEIDRVMMSILRTTPRDIMQLSEDGRDLTIKDEALDSPAVSYLRAEQVKLGKMPVRVTRLGLIDKVRAADQWCKMRKIYSDGPTVNVDNRKVEVIVYDKETKGLVNRLLSGEMPTVTTESPQIEPDEHPSPDISEGLVNKES